MATPSWRGMGRMPMLLWGGGVGLLVALAATAQGETPRDLSALLKRDWALGAPWSDGLAEIATYRAERVLDGRPRAHTIRLVTMAEEFTREYYTKAEWPHGQKPLLPVLRQSQIATVPGPAYDLHTMTSAFVHREDFGRLIKLSVVAHDWNGITHKEFQFWTEKPRMLFHSRWDGEGSGRRDLGTDINDYFEEELPLVLRALPFADGLEASLWLYPTQTTTRAPEPKPVAATLRVTEGNNRWRVDVEARDDRALRLEFSAEPPHVLLSLRHTDGRAMELDTVTRDAYWTLAE